VSDEQPRDRLGRFSQRLADDAAAAAAELEDDPALSEARGRLNEEFREVVRGERKKVPPRPGPDASREEWSEWVDIAYGPPQEPRDPMPPGAANAGDTSGERPGDFGASFNDMLRERRLGPRKSVEVIKLK
jgi:hypothetical protein